jgi:hypothetical protein
LAVLVAARASAILGTRAFSGEVDTGSPQKMRPSKEIERFHDSTQHESALACFQAEWNPVSRTQAGYSQHGRYIRQYRVNPISAKHAPAFFARTFGRKTGFHFS